MLIKHQDGCLQAKTDDRLKSPVTSFQRATGSGYSKVVVRPSKSNPALLLNANPGQNAGVSRGGDGNPVGYGTNRE